ncbi:MAG: iron complex transport system substrate-binding protein [Patiriisocius sp.]
MGFVLATRLEAGLILLLLGIWISTDCSAKPQSRDHSGVPSRVISLDYCADQFVLKLLPRVQILALSPDAGKPFSYMREQATGLPLIRPIAEDVLISQPDLVVRSYGGGPNITRFLEQAGIDVLQVGFANSIEDVKDNIRNMAGLLGVEHAGFEVVNNMEQRLAALSSHNPSSRQALYVTPGGVTAGPQTLIHEMIEAAGLRNFQTEPGWRQIPLEALAYRKPDILITAFYEGDRNNTNSWSASNHPVIASQISKLSRVDLDGATTSCGAWFLLDAIEAMAANVSGEDNGQ